MDIVKAVQNLYSAAEPLRDFSVQDDSDGKGAYIARWNLKDASGNPVVQPTDTQLQTSWDSLQLPIAQQAKLTELQAKCNTALATFPSSALGTAHTYLSGQTDMLLIEAEDRFMNSADYDGTTPILWYTIENSDVNHTKTQMHQVYLDARNNVQTIKYKMKNLVTQVNSATTIDQVNAIAW